MEAVIFEDSPLAAYLEGKAGDDEFTQSSPDLDSPRAATSFAPRGRPSVPSRFRNKLPTPLRISIPPNTAAAIIHNTCSKALNSRLGRADNKRFLEQFRYIIVASQLLNEHAYHGQLGPQDHQTEITNGTPIPQLDVFTLPGAVFTASVAFGLVWVIHWVRGGSESGSNTGRLGLALVVFLSIATLAYAFFRRQWLQYLRQQNLAEVANFVDNAQRFDTLMTAAVTLIQEIELVARGYRISTPLPPVTRLEDRKQNRRCLQLRRSLHECLLDLIPRYNQACVTLKPLAELLDLEKYYDIYDISELDLQEAQLGSNKEEFEDGESLRVLKLLAARFHTIRKVFLCCLLALDADGGKPDFFRWSTAVDELHAISEITKDSEIGLRQVLEQEETFVVPPTPKIPTTPGRERWRAQLRKLQTLSTGIRSLQAKLHVLREESDKTLDESEDLSELGPNLMIQYDSIGIDLRALMQDWEAGKAALANNIDRNEKRISSISGMLSPTISLGGLTSVDEGSPTDALRALNGEGDRSSLELSNSDAEEVFEAVAIPRQRSTLTREERIVKMKEDREKRESTRDKAMANTHMLRELESVINMRPRGKPGGSARIMSL